MYHRWESKVLIYFCASTFNNVILKTYYHFFKSALLIIFLCRLSPWSVQAQSFETNTILISEIFPDPTPSLGLPEKEFVEIYNLTKDTVLLAGFSICDESKCYTLPSFKFPPNNFIILCKNTDIDVFKPYGTVVGLPSFITLNNDGDHIYLKNKQGKTTHEMRYTSSMVKEGKTLESINFLNHCNTSSHWRSSSEPQGGTPGKVSKDQLSAKLPPTPFAKSASMENDSLVRIYFSDALDSLAVTSCAISVDDEIINPTSKKFHGDNNTLDIQFAKPFQPNFLYHLKITSLSDCYARPILKDTTLLLAVPSLPGKMDLVVNEILFNPKVGGVDFVEFCNTSKDKILDLKNWKVANYQNEKISNIKVISTKTLLIGPNTIIALTSDTTLLIQNHIKTGYLFQTDLPSFNDDKGSIILIDPKGNVFDRLDYTDDMHFEMLKNVEGISLERIYLKASTNDLQNWHSAAENAGFATPGYANSQAKSLEQNQNTQWKVDPIAFNPGGGSNKDFTTIHYNAPNLVNALASLYVYDANGRNVKSIAKNTTLSTEGFLRWDGTDDAGSLVPIGQYVLFIKIVHLDGSMEELKKQVVVTTF